MENVGKPSYREIAEGIGSNVKLNEDTPQKEIAELVSDVAIQKLFNGPSRKAKKAKESYKLTFKVRIKPISEGTPGEIRWMTIVTKKQDLKSSIRTMQAIRGLAAHMDPETFNRDLATPGRDVHIRVFELGQWMQKGGTEQYGVKIWNSDTRDWNTYGSHNWLGLAPRLATAEESKELPPDKTFVALNVKRPNDDWSTTLPPNASAWRRFRHAISRREMGRLVSALGSQMPMGDKFFKGAGKTHQTRIDNLHAVHNKILKDPDQTEWVNQQHAALRAEERRNQVAGDDPLKQGKNHNQTLAHFQYTGEERAPAANAGNNNRQRQQAQPPVQNNNAVPPGNNNPVGAPPAQGTGNNNTAPVGGQATGPGNPAGGVGDMNDVGNEPEPGTVGPGMEQVD